ncbi:hypothetical protein Ancab_006173 [Ancistrocladus abbreviatus]
MQIYNLYDVVTVSQHRSTIASEIRKNTHIDNPKVAILLPPFTHFLHSSSFFLLWEILGSQILLVICRFCLLRRYYLVIFMNSVISPNLFDAFRPFSGNFRII